MSARDLEGLLEPSLAERRAYAPIYSKRAGFFVAFFGGVYATLVFNSINSARLRRLGRDGALYLAAGALWSLALVWFGSVGLSESPPQWLELFGDAGRTVRYGGKVMAMLLFGAVAFLHRPYYAAQEMGATEPPNPWVVGVGAALLSMAVTAAMVALGRGLA
jgi:hypothetical protein